MKMRFKHWLPVVFFASVPLASCMQTNSQTTGIDLNNLDTTAHPGRNFYQYACGGWMKAHPLTDEYSRYGSFEELIENNNNQLRDLITSLAETKHADGSLEQKIGDLYNIAMDSTKQNKDGFTPIQADFQAIASLQDVAEVWPMMTELMRKGVSGYFDFYIDADAKNSSMNIVNVVQGGLSLGEKEYYTDNDTVTAGIRKEFVAHMGKMFALCGDTPEEAAAKAEAVMKIESRIAVPSFSATQQRDPEKNYHKMTVEDLKKDYAGIGWDRLFEVMGMKDVKDVNVAQPEPILEVGKILTEAPLADQKAYMQWKLIAAASPYLSDAFRTCRFDFYGRVLSGAQQERPRWKRAVSTVEGVMGEGLGRLYVDKHFPAAAKERMVKLVKNLQASLAERIKVQDWMSEETKKVALEKLNAFYVKVGYPDTWRDYSGLEIKDDSYWANIVRSYEFDLAYTVEKKLNKPVDRDEWYMTPQTVNAYYNPTTNEICFPAGILQPPFFKMEADDAANYGAIGVVIGHEMTHGFDDQGRQFDKNGNLTDWWAPGDAERFEERVSVMRDFFNGIEVLPGLKANGALTLGENLADHGGLMVAFNALRKAMEETPLETKDGFTPEQRFFLSYANVWAGNIRDEEIRRRTKSDPHSLGRWRVDGALPHIDMWYEAFGITEQDPMFIPKEERVKIW